MKTQIKPVLRMYFENVYGDQWKLAGVIQLLDVAVSTPENPRFVHSEFDLNSRQKGLEGITVSAHGIDWKRYQATDFGLVKVTLENNEYPKVINGAKRLAKIMEKMRVCDYSDNAVKYMRELCRVVGIDHVMIDSISESNNLPQWTLYPLDSEKREIKSYFQQLHENLAEYNGWTKRELDHAV